MKKSHNSREVVGKSEIFKFLFSNFVMFYPVCHRFTVMKLNNKKRTTIIILSILLVGIGGYFFWYTYMVGDRNFSSSAASGFTVNGADFSAHNGKVDFAALRNEEMLDFVLLKATEGRSFKDMYFERNYVAAKNAGLKIGAYHFFRFESSGELQAINFLHSLRGKELDLPVVIDVEEWTNPDNEQTDIVVDRIREMVDYLKARGLHVMVYSNRNGYNRFLRSEFGDCALWICSLREGEPEHRWDFWQFSHNGSLKGVEGNVDLNVFNGDSIRWAENLAKWKSRVQ